MKEISLNGIGRLVFDNLWKGSITINLFGVTRDVAVLFDGEIEDELEEEQISAYIEFLNKQKDIVTETEKRIFSYYNEVCDEYRSKYGDLAVKFAPMVSKKEDMVSLVNLQSIYFPWSFGSGERQFGFLFECSWEPEHGLAVKFINEHADEVGYQDIIL